MNFQFYCPQNHLLQADSSQAGTIIACPICGMQFVVPAPPPQAVAVPVVTPVSQPGVSVPSASGNSLDFSSSPSRKSGKGQNLNELLGGGDSPKTNAEESSQEANPFAMMNEKKVREQKKNDALEIKSKLEGATKAPPKAEELNLLHIPCPKGHVLDVDKDMLGERVQCPVCHSVYDLKLENSLEYIRERKAAEDREEARLGKIWIVRAGIAGILLLLFLIFLICT